MGSVMDYLQAIEATIIDSHPVDGKSPSRVTHRFVTVYKYSLLYLIQTKKIKFTDPEEKFIEFINAHPPMNHLKVANAYLRQNQKAEIQWEEPYAAAGR